MKRQLTAMLILVGCGTGLGAEEKNAFIAISGHYEAIRQVLMNDSTKEVSTHAQAIATIARDLRANFSAGSAGVADSDAQATIVLLPEISSKADELAAAGDIKTVRSALAELTKPLVRYHALVVGPRPVVAYCPMEKKAWLQPDEAIGNPYAPYMLRCGEVVQK
jgi:hypothetical protein